jgi:hypothetical protein
MKKMIWMNLKINKCPGCGKVFGALNFTEAGYINCTNSMANCDFRISEGKYMKIVNSQITTDLENQWNTEMDGGEKNE